MHGQRIGYVRVSSFENQRYRASGLNLVVAAIVLWNTAYLERVVQALRDTETRTTASCPICRHWAGSTST